MKRIFSILLIIFVFVLGSCRKKSDKNKDCTDYDYENCDTSEPFYGKLNLKLTINNENESVRVLVFEGNYESGVIIFEDEINAAEETYYLELNKKYSAAAYYSQGNDTIIAVDGGKLESYSYTMCEYTCYDVLNLSLDLRLKE
ncbi:MAG: hypothetical protein ACOCWC_01010 [Bacteroidota bacterium]